MEKKEIIAYVKKKSELSGIDDSVVRDLIEIYEKKNKCDVTKLREKEVKALMKETRAELRKYAGQFQFKTKDREKLLEKEDFDSLLKTHVSTKERIEIYPEIKEIIEDLKPKSIIDLGCGINPLAIARKEIEYYASDIHNGDLDIVRRFFEANDIEGNVFVYDLRKFNAKDLPAADVCILFKVLESIEFKGHKLAERIISEIRAKYIIVSFSTEKISGKKMNQPERKWIEKILERKKLKYERKDIGKEIFYIIMKDKMA
jgi:hypothetical protein